jgi:hypothetical protein
VIVHEVFGLAICMWVAVRAARQSAPTVVPPTWAASPASTAIQAATHTSVPTRTETGTPTNTLTDTVVPATQTRFTFRLKFRLV